MKIRIYLISILVISCNSKKTEIGKNTDSTHVSITAQSESVNWDDEFQGLFIYHFMTDSIFQKNRTKETITNLKYVNYFAEKDYTLHIFPSVEHSIDDNLFDDLDKQNKLTVIDDNAIKTFSFSKQNTKWNLTNFEISSFHSDSLKGFLGFIYQFSKDTSYRNAHIEFPLKFTYADAERDYNDTTEYLTVTDISEFSYDLFADKYFYFFHNGIDKINDAKYVCLLLRGIDNGIFLWYYFERQGNTWQLIEENDSST